MPEDQVEKESREKTIELGEWFNPFFNYENLPYKYEREDYRVKTVPFIIHPIGKFKIDTIWDRGSGYGREKALVVLPFGEEEINVEDFPNYEEKIESRLVDIGAIYVEGKYDGQDFPYQIEVRLPSGKVFVNPFETPDGITSLTGSGGWQEGKGNEKNWLLFPEVENILEKIQMRIAPKEEN